MLQGKEPASVIKSANDTWKEGWEYLAWWQSSVYNSIYSGQIHIMLTQSMEETAVNINEKNTESYIGKDFTDWEKR